MDVIRRLGFVVFGLLTIFGSYCQLAPASSTRHYEAGTRFSYDYETTVLINEGSSGKDVGYRITAKLGVSVVWQSSAVLSEKLLLVEVLSPKLHIKSRKAPSPEGFVNHASKLEEMENVPFLIHWKDGMVVNIYIKENEAISFSNLKRGIAALFQIRPFVVDTEEMDTSGHCSVSYKTEDGELYKKVKTSCALGEMSRNTPDNVTGVEINSFRDFQFSLASGSTILNLVTTNEIHEMKTRLLQDVKGRVVSKQEMRLSGDGQSTVKLLTVDSVGAAVIEMSKAIGAGLVKSELQIVSEDQTCQDDCPKLSKLVNDNRKNLEVENLGTSRSAAAFIKLLNVARKASADEILKVLKSQKNKNILPQLLDLGGATQTIHAHQAAMKLIHLETNVDVDLSERYLWALSLGSNPPEDVIKDLLKRSMKSIENEKLSETLILTLAAMTNKFFKNPGNEQKQILEKVKSFIVNELTSCQGEPCNQKFLRALKNLGFRDTVPIVLEYACNGTKKTSVTAMKTLKDFPSEYWDKDVIKASEKIFYQMGRKYDSSARTLAADIMLESSPSKDAMLRLLWYLAKVENRLGSDTEVCHYTLQRLKQLSEASSPASEAFAHTLHLAVAELNLYNYHSLSHKGLASALSWPFLQSTSSNGSLVSILEIASGLLKRGAIDIVLENKGESKEMFTLGLFAGGLSGFISSEETEEEEEEEEEYATAGMELTVLGVQLRPFVFFSGQGELMGLIWSGAGSERTPAFQTIALLQDHYQTISLQNGFMAVSSVLGAVSFDLSGEVQLSMWNRNAQSVVEKNAGVFIQGLLRVDSSFVRSQVETTVTTEAKLNLMSNLDFYNKVALCLQLKQPDVVVKQNTHKVERIIGSKHKLRKSTYKVYSVPGKTYALNRKNNENCNLIFSVEN